MKSKQFLKFFIIFSVLCTINCLIYVVITFNIGGESLIYGKILNDHYYLYNHGRYIETTSFIYNYSKWHTLSLFIPIPFGPIGAIYYTYLKNKESKEDSDSDRTEVI